MAEALHRLGLCASAVASRLSELADNYFEEILEVTFVFISHFQLGAETCLTDKLLRARRSGPTIPEHSL